MILLHEKHIEEFQGFIREILPAADFEKVMGAFQRIASGQSLYANSIANIPLNANSQQLEVRNETML